MSKKKRYGFNWLESFTTKKCSYFISEQASLQPKDSTEVSVLKHEKGVCSNPSLLNNLRKDGFEKQGSAHLGD